MTHHNHHPHFPRPPTVGDFTGVTYRIVQRLHLYQVPSRVRVFLDSGKFWFLVLVLASAGLGIGLYANYKANLVQSKQQVDDRVKAAQVVASANATYNTCLASIPALQKLELFIRGEKSESRILVLNAAAIVESTPPESDQYAVRIANFTRIQAADAKVQAGIDLPVPTVKSCEQRRQAVLEDAHPNIPPKNHS